MMIYDLLPYFFKKYQKYKSTLNVNVHVTINFKPCHYFYYDMLSFFFQSDYEMTHGKITSKIISS